MAVLNSIQKIIRTDDTTRFHYDVSYEGFVVVVKPEEIEGDHTHENILAVAAPKAAEIEASLTLRFTSETIEP